jgi:hypothetical protein
MRGQFAPSLTYEDLHRAVEAVDLYGGSVKQAAQALGKGEGALGHILRLARGAGMHPPAKERIPKKPRAETFGYKRHLFIPDTQIRPGVPTDHLEWIGQAIVDYRPDVVVHAGDHWDFPSLNSHNEPGSSSLENQRFQNDVDAGNAAFAKLCAPLEAELARKGNRWNPALHFLEGNHEERAERVAQADPKWLGHVGSNHCQVRGFKWHPFLERVWIDGICYSHFFQNSHSKHAIGGSVDNRLNKIGASFVQGHEQGFRYSTRITGSGQTWHGIVAGSCYLHVENYRGRQGQRHWRGIIILNEARDGEFDIMPLSLGYLCRKFQGEQLPDFLAKKYPDGNWEHLA